MTIGPAKRAWSGPLSVEGAVTFTSVTPQQERGSCRVRHEAVVFADQAGNQGRKIGPLLERTAGADQPASAIERAGLEFTPKQPVTLVRPGQPQRAGLLAREAKPRVLARVADEQHGTTPAASGLAHRV